MLRTVKLTPTIIHRLQSGENAKHLAAEMSLHLWTIYRIAKRHNIKLKKGRPPWETPLEVRRRRFDERHGPGAWVEFLQDAGRLSLQLMAEKWELRTRQNVWQILRYLGYEGDKPWVVSRRKLLRPDVAIAEIRKLAPQCRSQRELAERLNCSSGTILKRVSGTDVVLPKGNLGWKRRDITTEELTQLAKTKLSVKAISEALHCCCPTVKRRAQCFGITLPNGHCGPRPGTHALLNRIRRYLRTRDRKCTGREIASRFGISRFQVYALNHRYRLGIPLQKSGRRKNAIA